MTEAGKTVIIKDPSDLNGIKRKLENNLIVGHNLKFDSKFLKHQFGVTLYNVYDTYIAEIALSGGEFAGKKGASLKDLVFRYCGIELDKGEQCGFKYGVDLTQEQVDYALNDLKYLPEIVKQQRAKIRYLELEKVIDTEMKAIPAVVWLELSGMPLDLNKLAEIKEQLNKKKVEAEKKLNELFGNAEVNLNSPRQLLEALHTNGIQAQNTSSEELANFGGPIIETLKEYREATKLLNTFVEAIPEYISSATGRLHSNFNQYGTKSGRFTCYKPNLQQQPSKFTEWRSIYKAQPGNKIVTADYSQIELRILGQVSHDTEFIKAYNEGTDLHKLTASKVFKVPLEEVTKKQRGIAKTINFGLSYGMWVPSLISKLKVAGIEIAEDEAETYIRGFYKAYPGVSKYLWNISSEGARNFSIKNKAGRYFKFNYTEDKKELGRIKRESKNLPIQSLCADMIKDAMSNIFIQLEPMGVKFINTVHDEMVFECKSEIAEQIAVIVKEEMEKAGNVYLTDIPCISEVTISDQWEK